jgi:hypothetical protein
MTARPIFVETLGATRVSLHKCSEAWEFQIIFILNWINSFQSVFLFSSALQCLASNIRSNCVFSLPVRIDMILGTVSYKYK